MNATKQLAKEIALLAREIGRTGGDFVAQTTAYGLFLRQWDPRVRVDDLLETCGDYPAAIEIGRILKSEDLKTIFAQYLAGSKDPSVYFYENS